ncbi:hypothetical protein MHUMG1_03899 [Metarhizium humberi]|uniref:Aminotransferase class I/classII large domain-containing protein n=1 Tax=Metarhizium humberi TaxID=2596975 RepID=A0A9P8ME78_9HYPO|nr:hypothetical protein MHUMG1_03899 [Metarhizium humberi]
MRGKRRRRVEMASAETQYQYGRRTGGGILLFYLLCQPSLSLGQAHDVAQKISRRIQRTRPRKGQARKMKPLPQNGHRLAVIAWHPEDSVRHLLDDGWHASHRCGEPRNHLTAAERVREQGPKCQDTLHDSCAKALPIVELRQLSATPRADAIDPDLKLDYGPFEGSAKLRMCIAELHSTPEVPSKPNNPIGTIPPRSFLEEVVALAKRFNIAIFSDEVLTPLFHTDDPTPPPVESLGHENSV